MLRCATEPLRNRRRSLKSRACELEGDSPVICPAGSWGWALFWPAPVGEINA